jgi:hypothetical protein
MFVAGLRGASAMKTSTARVARRHCDNPSAVFEQKRGRTMLKNARGIAQSKSLRGNGHFV